MRKLDWVRAQTGAAGAFRVPIYTNAKLWPNPPFIAHTDLQFFYVGPRQHSHNRGLGVDLT